MGEPTVSPLNALGGGGRNALNPKVLNPKRDSILRMKMTYIRIDPGSATLVLVITASTQRKEKLGNSC